jgi:N-acetylmuramoyl-L-alanine amidase
MKQKRIAISVGHHPDKPGFINEKYSEYSEMAAVAGLLIRNLLYKKQLPYLIGTGRLGKKVEEINDLNVELAVELHLNAGGGHGVETLYCPGSQPGKEWAEIIQKHIVHPGIRDRGTKEGWYHQDKSKGKLYFLEKTNCPSVIIESYFLDNKEEVEKYAGNLGFYSALAFDIANAIMEK